MPCLYSRKKNAEASVNRGIGDSIHGSAVLVHSWVTRDKNQCAMYF